VCGERALPRAIFRLGATIVSQPIAEYFDNNALGIGLTYSAHAVACAAAVENINILEEENMVENAAKMGRYIDATKGSPTGRQAPFHW
jgi:taurine---2-oxoglutarate transaminase